MAPVWRGDFLQRRVWQGHDVRRAGMVGTIALAVGLLAIGCSSGDDAGDAAELCSTYERFTELDDELLAPDVFALSADELEAVLDDRSHATASMADLADGELRDRLEDAADFGSTADDLLVDAWRSDREDLEAAGDGWIVEALLGHDELVRPDGRRLATAVWVNDRTPLRELLYVACVEPELAGGPAQDRTERAPDGLISYFRFTDVATATGERLAVATAGDEAESPFVLPSGWRSPLYGDVAGGRVVFNASHDDGVGLLSFDRHGDPEVAYDGDTPLSCPSWSSDGRSILAPEQSFSGSDRGVFEVRGGTARALGLDLALQGCAADIGDGRLLIAPAAASLAEAPGAAVVDRGGSDLAPLDLPAHCTPALGDVDAARRSAALAVRCSDPHATGLWIVDLTSLSVSQILHGVVGTPKFSPDGTWLTFSFAPLGTRPNDPGTAVWLVQADGTGTRELVAAPASFPLWLPAGAG